MMEEKVLVTRGKSAVRSLKLLLVSIGSLQRRIKDHIQSIDKENPQEKLMRSHFEEIEGTCGVLEEEGISSIEDWTDIIPEVANLKTQIGTITEMRGEVETLTSELTELKAENTKLTELTQEGAKDKELSRSILEENNRTIEKKEMELSQLRERLKKSETAINNTVLSGIAAFGSGALGSRSTGHIGPSRTLSDDVIKLVRGINQNKTCSQCGKPYGLVMNVLLDNGKCEACNSER